MDPIRDAPDTTSLRAAYANALARSGVAASAGVAWLRDGFLRRRRALGAEGQQDEIAAENERFAAWWARCLDDTVTDDVLERELGERAARLSERDRLRYTAVAAARADWWAAAKDSAVAGSALDALRRRLTEGEWDVPPWAVDGFTASSKRLRKRYPGLVALDREWFDAHAEEEQARRFNKKRGFFATIGLLIAIRIVIRIVRYFVEDAP